MARFHLVDGNNKKFTAAEEKARDAEEKAWADNAVERALNRLRQKRDKLLAETDFHALSDSTLSVAMKAYRKKLRDLPSGKNTVAKCDNVKWPTKPS